MFLASRLKNPRGKLSLFKLGKYAGMMIITDIMLKNNNYYYCSLQGALQQMNCTLTLAPAAAKGNTTVRT